MLFFQIFIYALIAVREVLFFFQLPNVFALTCAYIIKELEEEQKPFPVYTTDFDFRVENKKQHLIQSSTITHSLTIHLNYKGTRKMFSAISHNTNISRCFQNNRHIYCQKAVTTLPRFLNPQTVVLK